VGQYLERTRAAAGPHGIDVVALESWATEPAFVDFLAADVRRRLSSMPPNTKTLFTAHSLPTRIIASGDPYPDELNATAAAVAAAAGLGESSPWSIAWQSAGRTPEPWIGPDILAVIDDLAASEAADGVLVCACGFVADHLEVLYDLDIEARQRAESHGLVFDRTACVNDDPVVIGALAARTHDLARR
jgi:ferrochelatase